MLWLYWRRVRPAFGRLGIALAVVAVVSALAISLGGPAPASKSRRPGASGLRPYAVPRTDVAQVRRGQLLMTAAAAACQSMSYHGVQMVAWSGLGGSNTYLIEVWHRPGQPELAEGDEDIDERSPGTGASGNAAVGVLSITPRMLSLLRANYLIEYAGAGTSSNRPAQIVALRRHDGSLAARYWLDRLTGLPLRREMFDSRGHLVSEGAFIDLQIGDKDVALAPPPQTPAWLSQPTTTSLVTLRRHGWTVPSTLAGNLALVGMTSTPAKAGQIVDASYSDGLSVVSVFVQRGQLPDALPGWRHAVISGVQVFLTQPAKLGERGLAWSAGGFVYTVIADAPRETVAQVVAQLPHDRHIGIWQRLGRGLERIASWFNPFG